MNRIGFQIAHFKESGARKEHIRKQDSKSRSRATLGESACGGETTQIAIGREYLNSSVNAGTEGNRLIFISLYSILIFILFIPVFNYSISSIIQLLLTFASHQILGSFCFKI